MPYGSCTCAHESTEHTSFFGYLHLQRNLQYAVRLACVCVFKCVFSAACRDICTVNWGYAVGISHQTPSKDSANNILCGSFACKKCVSDLFYGVQSVRSLDNIQLRRLVFQRLFRSSCVWIVEGIADNRVGTTFMNACVTVRKLIRATSSFCLICIIKFII